MKLSKLYPIFLVWMLIAGGIPSLEAAASRPQGMCPVMPHQPVKEKFYVDYQGKRVYFCCRACVKAFKKHPGRYLKP